MRQKHQIPKSLTHRQLHPILIPRHHINLSIFYVYVLCDITSLVVLLGAVALVKCIHLLRLLAAAQQTIVAVK